MHGLQGVTLFEEEEEEVAPPSSRQVEAAAAASSPGPATAAAAAAAQAQAPEPPRRKFVPRERAVPSSSVGRALGFAQLGGSLLYGTMRESVSRAFGGSKQAADGCAGFGCCLNMGQVPAGSAYQEQVGHVQGNL